VIRGLFKYTVSEAEDTAYKALNKVGSS